MSRVKSLYLSYDGLTDPLGQSQILPYVCGLTEKGYLITIVSFEKPSRFEKLKKDISLICESNNVRWIPLRYHKRPAIISTVYDLFLLYRVVEKCIKQDGYNVVHCRSYLTSTIGLAAKRKWQVKFIFDMRGFWADERVEGGLWNLKNPVYNIIFRYFKRKERQFLMEADYIVSLTNNAKDEIKSWCVSTTPIIVIPTCVDVDLFNPATISEEMRLKKRGELGIGREDFLLAYSGSWGTWYLTDQIIEFYEVLRREKRRAKLLILTHDKVSLPSREDIIIKGANRGEMPLLLSCANAAVFFIKPTFSKKASSATKLGELMAMNIPLVTNSGWGDIKQYESESIIVLRDDSGDQLRIGAASLVNVKKTPTNSRIESLTLKFGIQQYDRVYQSVSR